MSFLVEDFSSLRNLTPEYLYFHIDKPSPGEAFSDSHLQVSGWTFSENSPIKKVILTIEEAYSKTSVRTLINNNVLLEEARPTIPRPVVVEEFPEKDAPINCGFDVVVNVRIISNRLRFRLTTILEDGSIHDLATWKINHDKPINPITLTYTPILLSAFGRSGTTLAMRLLASHKDIISSEEYPYENQMVRYTVKQALAAAHPLNRNIFRIYGGYRNDARNFSPAHFSGSISDGSKAWMSESLPLQLANFAVTSLNDYYLHLGQITKKSNALYFVEKEIGDRVLTTILEEITGIKVKRIFLFRDIRDIFCSVQSFNKKRGNLQFLRRQYPDDIEYMRFLGDFTRDLIAQYEAEKQHFIAVIYDDLVLNPQGTLAKLFDYLEIEDLSHEVAKNNQMATFKHHRTSKSEKKSIARWQSELAPDLAKLVEEEYADVIEFLEPIS